MHTLWSVNIVVTLREYRAIWLPVIIVSEEYRSWSFVLVHSSIQTFISDLHITEILQIFILHVHGVLS
jgi:hypothetical protein